MRRDFTTRSMILDITDRSSAYSSVIAERIRAVALTKRCAKGKPRQKVP